MSVSALAKLKPCRSPKENATTQGPARREPDLAALAVHDLGAILLSALVVTPGTFERCAEEIRPGDSPVHTRADAKS
jgi:hypothetical protein